MFLQPKKSKYKKYKKGKLTKLNFKSNKLVFGSIGIKSLESGIISSRQIEAARQAISRRIQRKGKLWIRIFPSYPVTKKPIEVRMGKGKGAVNYWAAKVSGGSMLFELEGIPNNIAMSAFKTGSAKLPLKTIICKH